MKKFKKRICVFSAVAVVILTAAALVNTSLFASLCGDLGVTSIYQRCAEYPFCMYFFDVGRANAVLIRCDGYNILIDSGMEKAQNNILDNLEILDVDKLDLLVLTHPDKDHIGNMSDVVENVAVDRFVTCQNGDYEITELYGELIETLDDCGIEAEYTSAGDEFVFGSLNLQTVSPGKVYNSTNSNCVALKASYENFSAFLAADIGFEVEKDIISSGFDISSDILCVAHHGSRYSTSEEFLCKVNPHDAIISTQANEYLPSNYTLKRLIDFGCDIYRTDESGIIAVVSDGKEYSIITQY